MTKKQYLLLACWLGVLMIAAGSAGAQEQGCFQPRALWPDNNGIPINAHGGGILFHQGTYYWYGEHKVAGVKGNKAYVGVRCYASTDLCHWKDEGVALAVDSTPGSLIMPGSIIERPKVIYSKKTKQFVMWFHLELKGKGYKSALCGVATSKTAAGPFRFHHAERPNKGSLPVGYTRDANGGDSLLLRDTATGQMARDMNLFVDDDGKAYLVYTSEENRTVHISLLSNDYLTTTDRYARLFPNRFMEAAAVFKRGGRYYFVASGCTGWAPNAARSAVADQLFGPWKELGNPCKGPKAGITFGGQSTYVLPVAGKKEAFIFMADEWRPDNAIDGRYIWLPITFEKEGFSITWQDRWSTDQLFR